jgi:hypothetical protein
MLESPVKPVKKNLGQKLISIFSSKRYVPYSQKELNQILLDKKPIKKLKCSRLKLALEMNEQLLTPETRSILWKIICDVDLNKQKS